MGDVVRAVDAVAQRCDELSERITRLSTVTDDLAGSLSEEVTELRTIVEHLRRHIEGTPQSSDR
jgi:tetrahydromethanopterin S-methyltransferase subunit B